MYTGYFREESCKGRGKARGKGEDKGAGKGGVKLDMKKHRSVCIYCPFCGYQNRKKDRLLRHIETKHREQQPQDSPQTSQEMTELLLTLV